MLDQRHGDGIENPRLGFGREAALELEEREVAERHLAQEVGQVMAADDDAVGRAPGDVRTQLLAGHTLSALDHRWTVNLVL